MNNVSHRNKVMKGRTRRIAERGAGLVEVVVATLMASVGLLAVAQLFGVTVLLNARGRNNTGVARAAQVTFEGLRAADFTGSALAATSGSGTTAVYTPGTSGSFNVTTQITDLAASSGTLKRLCVTVAETATGGNAWLARGNNQAVFVTFRTTTANGQYFDLNTATSSTTPTATPTVTPTATPTATPVPTPTVTPTATPTSTPTPTPTPTPRACSKNEVPASAGCTCQPPMSINTANGKCQ